MIKIFPQEIITRMDRKGDFLSASLEARLKSREYYKDPTQVSLVINELNIDFLQFDQEPVGAFKLRGAVNAVRELFEHHGRNFTVVCASSGNFGLGVAHAARIFELDCKVYVPCGTPDKKLQKLEWLGAETVGGFLAYEDAKAAAKCHGEREGHYFLDGVSESVLIGNASIILDVIETLDLVNGCIVMPLGIGSLAYPAARILRESGIKCDLIVCESDQYPKMCRDLDASVAFESGDTIADGIRVAEVPAETKGVIRESIASVYAFSDHEILKIMRYLWQAHSIQSEGASACSLGPMVYDPEVFRSYTKCVAIGTGSNVDPVDLL